MALTVQNKKLFGREIIRILDLLLIYRLMELFLFRPSQRWMAGINFGKGINIIQTNPRFPIL